MLDLNSYIDEFVFIKNNRKCPMSYLRIGSTRRKS
jgi:hypothetical protein